MGMLSKMTRIFFILCLYSLLLFSCKTDESPEDVSNGYSFIDDFETEGNAVTDLFPADGSRWTALQLVHPGGGTNTIELTQDHSSRGLSSIEITALPSDSVLSKAAIEKGGLRTVRGSSVTIKADFRLSETGSFENVFLIDFECCACWDPSVPDNQCPGVRLMFDENGEYLQMERGKIALPTITQQSVVFPRGEWVTVEWRLILSEFEVGSNQLFINGNEALSVSGPNLPNQAIFDSLFTAEGIDFQLQEPLGYERLQFGATANPSSDTARIWVDNVQVVVLE
jgi:hypothetical protein